jgi:hypothetical protein
MSETIRQERVIDSEMDRAGKVLEPREIRSRRGGGGARRRELVINYNDINCEVHQSFDANADSADCGIITAHERPRPPRLGRFPLFSDFGPSIFLWY